MTNYLRVGIISSLFGINGEVKVIQTTDDKHRFSLLNNVYVINKNEYKALCENEVNFKQIVENFKFLNDKVVLKFKNIDSVEKATNFIHKEIYVNRLNAVNLNANEYYVADIIGCDLFLENKCLGKVLDVLFTKANSNLITNINNKQVYIPMVSNFIHSIDIINNKIFLKTVDGLLDL